MMGLSPQCYITSNKVIGPLVLERKIFEVFFYHIWAWRPSWSCYPDPANKLSFLHPTEAPYEIWLRLAKRFWRRRSLKMVAGRRTCLYYKLIHQPKGSCELTMTILTVYDPVHTGDKHRTSVITKEYQI